MISSIERLQPLQEHAVPRLQPEKGSDSMFGDVFRSAVDRVRETDQERSETEYLLATGQLDNPASLGIAAAKNEIAVSMLIQLRNKAMEAYNEIMRTGM